MLVSSVYSQYTDSSFNIPTTNQMVLSINQTYNNDTSFVLNVGNTLYGLAISGRCTLNTNKSMVRVLLSDDCNNEHLIYENYILLADSNICNFSNIGIETSLLDSIVPVKMVVQITDAELLISNISYTTDMHSISQSQMQARRNVQNNAIVTQLNNNLRKRNMTWRAGVTFISSLSYEEKKTIFGTDTLPNLYGIEYYKGGIYVSPDYEYSTQEKSSSKFVDYFDWRNRHGKNWITSVKSQGTCGSCWAYSATGLVEAYINLFYNQLINYDLSEQEIISCSYEHPTLITANGCEGGATHSALKYIKYKGIVLEECFPYVDFYYDKNMIINQYKYTMANCSDKCDTINEFIKIKDYTQLNDVYIIDTIKSYLFKQPLTVSVHYTIDNKRRGHAMLMVGYKTLHTGDSLCIDYLSDTIIEASEEMEGVTAYIMKNSWGVDWGDNGYGYLVTPYKLEDMYQISGDIRSLIYYEKDRLCKDEDGDGYYFWGLGSRPYNLPKWVPRKSDGDDSDAQYGPMDNYGNLMNLNPDNRDTIFIKEPINWNSENYIWQHIIVKNGGLLNITSDIKFYKGVNIVVEGGGKLIVDGVCLDNPNINISSKGELVIKNKGKINKYKNFIIDNGAIVKFENGIVN